MNVNSIINLALIAIIVICAWQGYKKGIIMGIIEVLVIILSLYGAQLLSDTYSYEVIPVLKPFASGYLENQVEETAFTAMGYEPDEKGVFHVTYSLTDLLNANEDLQEPIVYETFKDLGVYESMAQTLTARTMAYAKDEEVSLPAAVVNVACQSVTWYGGFLLAFLIVFAVLTVIVNLPNLSFKIPYFGIVNDIGGIAVGVFVGLMFCSLIVWALQFTGIILPEDTLRATGLAAYLLDKNMLAAYITL